MRVAEGGLEEFGPDRIRDTPLSVSALVGAGIGAALGGMRPIVEYAQGPGIRVLAPMSPEAIAPGDSPRSTFGACHRYCLAYEGDLRHFRRTSR